MRRGVWFRFWPQSKPAAEGVGIVARTNMRRKRRELPHVAASDHRFIGLERGDEPCHDVGDVPPPLPLAVPFQPGAPDIVFIGALFVGQVTEFHGLDKACMAASLMTLTGRPNAPAKSNPTHPRPRLCGSAIGRPRSTGPG